MSSEEKYIRNRIIMLMNAVSNPYNELLAMVDDENVPLSEWRQPILAFEHFLRALSNEYYRLQVISPERESVEPVGKKYTVSATASGEGGRIEPSGDVKVDEGGSVTFTITPDDGWKILSLYDNGTDVTGSIGDDKTYTISGISEDHVLEASFEEASEYAIRIVNFDSANIYRIYPIPDESGTIVVSKGSRLALDFTLNSNCAMKSIFVDGEDVTEEIVPRISQRRFTYIIRFDSVMRDHKIEIDPKVYYRVDVSNYPTLNGSISPEPNSNGYIMAFEGDGLKVKFIPNDGYAANAVIDGNEYQKIDGYIFENVHENHRLRVWFAEASRCTIIVNASNPNAGSVEGGGEYYIGQQVDLKAMPYSGYDFLNWTENGEEISREPRMSFEATGDRTITANFRFSY